MVTRTCIGPALYHSSTLCLYALTGLLSLLASVPILVGSSPGTYYRLITYHTAGCCPVTPANPLHSLPRYTYLPIAPAGLSNPLSRLRENPFSGIRLLPHLHVPREQLVGWRGDGLGVEQAYTTRRVSALRSWSRG
jgi:hypothetical protein